MFRRVSMALFAVVYCVGCGSNELAPVTGRVIHHDKPLTSGTICFRSETGGQVGYATIQSDGSYVVRTGSHTGLKPGDYRVAVTSTAMPDENASDPEPTPVLLTPERYADPDTSGLRCTVPDEGTKFDITLEAN